MTADEMLREVHQSHGLTFTLDGRGSGGDVGALFARAADGRRFVFKWSEDPSDLGFFADVVGLVEGLRARGYPAPHYLDPLAIEGGVVVFQEAVAGNWTDEVDHALADCVLELNDLQAEGQDDRGSWTAYVARTLTEGMDRYCIHETLEHHSATTRRLLSWVRTIGRELRQLPGRDVVHVDFHHRNILREGSHLVTVIDWEGCRAGDRVFDLVTFCFGMTHATGESGVEQKIWSRAVDLATVETLRAYVAHMALRRVDWTVRHHPEEMNRLMSLVESYVELVA